MSINSVSSSSFGCEGPDYELIQIMRLLMIYGVVPTGNKATDKARLHDIELLRAKNQNEPSGKFFTISYKQEQEIIEKRRLLKYGSKENYKKEKGIRFISYRDHIGNKYEQAYDKARSKVSKFKAFIRMYATEKSYLDRCAKDGEEIFARNIASISERLIKNNLNVNNLSISDVKNDPKFFEMMLSDGTKKLYLRLNNPVFLP